MAYYTQKELKQLGFKYLGKNVKISDKASIYNFDQISIDDNPRIDDFCLMSGKIKIGKNILLLVLVLLLCQVLLW